MSGITQCAYLTCADDCCNYYGYCPEDYDKAQYGEEYTQCYHYYNQKQVSSSSAYMPYLISMMGLLAILLFIYLRKNNIHFSLSGPMQQKYLASIRDETGTDSQACEQKCSKHLQGHLKDVRGNKMSNSIGYVFMYNSKQPQHQRQSPQGFKDQEELQRNQHFI